MKQLFSKFNNALVAVATGFLLLGAVAFVSPASPVAAQEIGNKLCAGSQVNLGGNGAACQNGTGADGAQNRVNRLIRLFLNLFSVIVGVVAVVMIIIGGFKYITSGGDSGKLSSAKQTIIYALVGLLVVALAQFVVRFVLNQAAGNGSSISNGAPDDSDTANGTANSPDSESESSLEDAPVGQDLPESESSDEPAGFGAPSEGSVTELDRLDTADPKKSKEPRRDLQ